MSADGLGQTIEALLFLSPDPVSAAELAEAIEVDEDAIAEAIDELEGRLKEGGRGVQLRRVAGGFALAAAPRPRTPPGACSPSPEPLRSPRPRPRCSPSLPTCSPSRGRRWPASAVSLRLRGPSLTERGMIEERGRHQFGAVTYGTTPLFEKLFGLSGLDALPDAAQFDPTPEDERELRERLLKAGEQRVE